MTNNSKINLQTMLEWLFTVCVFVHITSMDQCAGYSHSITGLFTNAEDGMTFLEKTLFTRNTTTPKSYVVGFKYVGDTFSGVIYNGRIYSNAQDTWGFGDLSNGLSIHDDHYLNAQIHIRDATNFDVGVELRGMMGIGYIAGLYRWIKVKQFRPRSSALICAIDKNQPQTKYRELVFGKRKDGDSILHARRVSFSYGSELPRHKLEFEDKNVNLTAAVIRFNTTKAIVFHNKVKLTEQHFSATIYGLSRDNITAAYIIYGNRT